MALSLAVIGGPRRMGHQKKRIVLKSDFVERVGMAEITLTDFAKEAGIGRSTLYGLLNPESHKNRRGGMHRNTAWAMARAYTRAWNAVAEKNQAQKVTAEEAFAMLFDEVVEGESLTPQ